MKERRREVRGFRRDDLVGVDARIVEALSSRERGIIGAYFGIDEPYYTLAFRSQASTPEIANALGLTQPRTRQLLNEAVIKVMFAKAVTSNE